MKANSRWAKSNLTDRLKWLRSAGSSGGPLVQTLLQQGHPEQAAQGRIQVGCEVLQGGDSTTLRATCANSFLMVSQNLLCSSLHPLPLVVALGTTGKSLTPY